MTDRPSRPRVLALIQAGGKGGRMDVLTRETPKPALPFAGAYRMIDFPLSNLRNSDITDVWLSVQYLGQDVADVVGNGKPWDLDRHHGGFRLVMPEQGSGASADEGFVSGNAEELLQNRDAIRRHDPDAVVVLSADHAYRLDYRAVVDEHLRREAECTIVTTEVGIGDAGHHAVVTANRNGRVTKVDHKPGEPRSGVVATEVFVYAPGPLIEVLETLHRDLANDPDSEPEADGSALGDFGEHLVPALVRRGKTFAYPLPGYWRDLGRPEAYFAAHQELLHTDVGLFDPEWPIITNSSRHVPARILAGGRVDTSLISADCRIAGRVRQSVLGPGVVVGEGATVTDSIVFADVVIEPGAEVAFAIIDTGTVVRAGARVGSRIRTSPAGPDDLTLVGKDCRIGPDVKISKGARLEPGTTSS